MGGLFDDMVPDRGTVHLLDAACTALWRRPDFEEVRPASERMQDAEPPPEDAPNPFTDEEVERLIILGGVMAEGHPHEPHWYLNVVSTLPSPPGPGPRLRRSCSRCSPRPTPRAGPATSSRATRGTSASTSATASWRPASSRCPTAPASSRCGASRD